MTPSSASNPLVVLDRVTVARPGGHVVLDDLSWTIRRGETWAVVGPVGSGKTALAETLLGKHPVRSGSISWPVLDRLRATGRTVAFPSEVIRHVAFKEDSRLFSYTGHYYQQRFEFADADEPLTLDQYLRSGTDAPDPAVRDAARRLGIEPQLPLSFIKLSNGQTRRARIARALLAHPELLILDDPFIGVDAAGRADIADVLGELVKKGLPLVLICPPDAVPEWMTHQLDLGKPRAAQTNPSRNPSPGPSPKKGGEEDFPGLTPPSFSGKGVGGLGSEGNPSPGPSPKKGGEEDFPGLTPPSFSGKGVGGFGSSSIVELRNVSVSHGGKVILSDITWTVRAGERWAVIGPNGSGKTTLLSLLCGDHPQAYSNHVRLFGRQRGTGESVWEVKRQVGLVSPEFHLYFTEPLTADRAAATGFFDAVTARPTTPEQDAAVRELFDEFGIANLARRPFRQLSTGEQRLVLLVRALVKRPPLLILDEPFQGLDGVTAGRARDWLDRNLTPDQTLLFVSHQTEEIPRTATRRLCMGEGRVVEMV